MSVQKLTIDLFGILKIDAEIVSENGSIGLSFKGLTVTGSPQSSGEAAVPSTKRTEVSPAQYVSNPIEDMAMAAAAGPPKGAPDLGIVNHLGEKTVAVKSDIVPEFLSPPVSMLAAAAATTSTVVTELKPDVQVGTVTSAIGPAVTTTDAPTAVVHEQPVVNTYETPARPVETATSVQSPSDTQMDVFSQFAVINHAVPTEAPPTDIGGVPVTAFLPMDMVPEAVRPDVQGAYEKLLRKEDGKIRTALTKLVWPAGADISGIERLDRNGMLILAFNVLVNTAKQKK